MIRVYVIKVIYIYIKFCFESVAYGKHKITSSKIMGEFMCMVQDTIK